MNPPAGTMTVPPPARLQLSMAALIINALSNPESVFAPKSVIFNDRLREHAVNARNVANIAERCLMKFEFLTLVQRKRRFKTSVSKRPSVEIPRLERGLSEPKSLVLPLHHTSIHLGKDRINFAFCQKYFAPDA